MSKPPIIIAGGGIAGLSAAIALSGHDLEIWEQAASFSPVGAGVQIGPNAVRALQQLGAWDAVSTVTTSPPEIHLRDAISGTLVKRVKLGKAFAQRFGTPYRTALRADLHKALLDVVTSKPHISIKMNCPVSSVEEGDGHMLVRAGVGARQASGVIAADGIHSTIRQAHFADSPATRASHDFHRALPELISIPGVEIECVNLWMHPHGHVVHYPAGSPARLNLVAIVPRGKNPRHFFAQVAEPLLTLIHNIINDEKPWPGLFVKPLKQWSRNGVLLIGDAAHGTLPYLAQGAAMALEDAAALKMASQKGTILGQAFAEVERARMTRTLKIHKASLAAGRAYHVGGLVRPIRNLALSALPGTVFNARLSWIYNDGTTRSPSLDN